MTRKRRRLYVVLACGVGLGTATALALSAMSSSLTFFITPSQIADRAPPPGHVFRLGGLVEAGTVHRMTVDGHPAVTFGVGDGKHTVLVNYTGILPDLFRVGQGIVVIGSIAPGGQFRASEVLAKHSEDYMPPAVVNALKKSGEWNPASGKPPPPASTWDGFGPSPATLTRADLSRGVGEVDKVAEVAAAKITSPATRERSAPPQAAPGEGARR